MLKELEVPVLFLIFNRPEPTRKVFEQIRLARPKHLYIAADGARAHKTGEKEICQLTRQTVLDQVDWPCQVHTLFRDQNLGCKTAVSQAIDWFFNQVEEGIILEDDCQPDPSFFSFCQEVLTRYKDDPRVMHIGGSNFVPNPTNSADSYYFSRFANIWGWATWKRAWHKYDVTMKLYPDFKQSLGYASLFEDGIVSDFFENYTESVYSGKTDTWDLQWLFTVLVENGLCIVPYQNLISNIGFGENATHTMSDNHQVGNRKTNQLASLQHPLFVCSNFKADAAYFDRVHGGKEIRKSKTWQGKLSFFWWKVKFKTQLLLGVSSPK